MSETPKDRYTLEELEAASGVSARTIRNYTSLKLLPSPPRGRGAYYTAEHLVALQRISALKVLGHSLDKIRCQLDGLGGVPEPVSFNYLSWLAAQPTEDVVVFVRAGLDYTRKNQIDRALAQFFGAIITRGKTHEEG